LSFQLFILSRGVRSPRRGRLSLSLWRRQARSALLKWTVMTVGALSMDLHTNRKRHHGLCQDKQWARHQVTGMRNLRHQRGQILAGLRWHDHIWLATRVMAIKNHNIPVRTCRVAVRCRALKCSTRLHSCPKRPDSNNSRLLHLNSSSNHMRSTPLLQCFRRSDRNHSTKVSLISKDRPQLR
jgi:hypothetical protein